MRRSRSDRFVVEWNGEVAHEGKHAVAVVADPVEEIVRFALLAAAPPFRARRWVGSRRG